MEVRIRSGELNDIVRVSRSPRSLRAKARLFEQVLSSDKCERSLSITTQFTLATRRQVETEWIPTAKLLKQVKQNASLS